VATHPNLSSSDHAPVNAIKPRVVHNVPRPPSQITEPLGSVGHEQASDQIAGDRVDVTGKDDLARKDLFVDGQRIVRVERRDFFREEAKKGPSAGAPPRSSRGLETGTLTHNRRAFRTKVWGITHMFQLGTRLPKHSRKTREGLTLQMPSSRPLSRGHWPG
jgi:hypothetical protein